MKRADLIGFMAHSSSLKRGDVESLLDSLIKGIIAGIKVDGQVTLVGLGTFHTTLRNRRTGTDPRNSKAIVVPERVMVKFKPGLAMREAAGSRTEAKGEDLNKYEEDDE